MSQSTQPIRWWPLPIMVVIYAIALFLIWSGEGLNRQLQHMQTIASSLLLGFVIVLWLLFFARLQKKLRLIVFALFLGSMLVAGFTVEIRGVTGDLIPIFAWRWSPTADELLNAEGVTATASQIETTDKDYPRYLGPDGNGILSGPKLATDWQTNPPQEMWRIEVGLGWSSFATVNDYTITMEQRGEQEMVVCYDLNTGEIRWQQGVAMRHSDILGGDGPRATPTITDGKVYSLGARGMLQCLDLATGERIWSVNILEDNGAEAPPFGVSVSPLVLDDQVLVQAGGVNGTLAAYDRHTGKRLFSGGSDPAGYSTVEPAVLAGVPQHLVFNSQALAGHDVTTGAQLWRFPWPSGSEHVAQPLILSEDRVFMASGYGVGGRMLQISKDEEELQVKELWSSRAMKAKFCTVFYRDGFIYGLDDGILACIDEEKGKRQWKRGRFGHGQMMMVGDLFVILTEKGEVALVRVDPTKFEEVARIPVLNGKTWNHPALVGDLLLVRNDREAVCLKLPLEQ